MPRIDVVLGGRAYPIQCGDGEEDRVRSIAAYVDGKIARLRSLGTPGGQSGGQVGEAQLLAMACLMIGDELFDAQSAMRRQADGREPITGPDETMLADAVSQLAGHVESLVARVNAA